MTTTCSLERFVRHGTILLAALTFAACGSDPSGPVDVDGCYALTRVDGGAVPAVIASNTDTTDEGAINTYRQIAVGGTLKIGDGTYRMHVDMSLHHTQEFRGTLTEQADTLAWWRSGGTVSGSASRLLMKPQIGDDFQPAASVQGRAVVIRVPYGNADTFLLTYQPLAAGVPCPAPPRGL